MLSTLDIVLSCFQIPGNSLIEQTVKIATHFSKTDGFQFFQTTFPHAILWNLSPNF